MFTARIRIDRAVGVNHPFGLPFRITVGGHQLGHQIGPLRGAQVNRAPLFAVADETQFGRAFHGTVAAVHAQPFVLHRGIAHRSRRLEILGGSVPVVHAAQARGRFHHPGALQMVHTRIRDGIGIGRTRRSRGQSLRAGKTEGIGWPPGQHVGIPARPDQIQGLLQGPGNHCQSDIRHGRHNIRHGRRNPQRHDNFKLFGGRLMRLAFRLPFPVHAQHRRGRGGGSGRQNGDRCPPRLQKQFHPDVAGAVGGSPATHRGSRHGEAARTVVVQRRKGIPEFKCQIQF